jgi:hypothetical protein
MPEEIFKNKASLYRLSSFAALISGLFILASLVLLVIFPTPELNSSLSEKLIFIANHFWSWVLPFTLLFIVIILQIPIIFAFYILTRQNNFLLSTFGLLAGIVSSFINLQIIFNLITSIPRMAKLFISTGDELLKYSIIASFSDWGVIQMHALSLGQLLLGFFLAGVMMLMFGISLFKSMKLPRIVGWVLFIAGGFSMVGFVGYLINNKYVELAFIIQIFFYFCSLLIMFPLFQNEATMYQAIKSQKP